MKPVPPVLLAHFKAKGYAYMGGRLFVRNGKHWLLFNNAKGEWTLSPCWVAKDEPQAIAAE
jgi:hypothetical protein